MVIPRIKTGAHGIEPESVTPYKVCHDCEDMRRTVVHAKIRVATDGTISGKAPRELPPGEYEAPIILPADEPRRPRLNLPRHDAPWDDTVSLRREDIYGENGR